MVSLPVSGANISGDTTRYFRLPLYVLGNEVWDFSGSVITAIIKTSIPAPRSIWEATNGVKGSFTDISGAVQTQGDLSFLVGEGNRFIKDLEFVIPATATTSIATLNP